MPRAFSLMSGNFDDPPASDSYLETATRVVQSILNNSDRTADDISPSGELYRAIERFRRRRGHLPGEPRVTSNMSEQDAERRRRGQGDGQEGSPLFVLPGHAANEQRPHPRELIRLAAGSSRRGRARAFLSDRMREAHSNAREASENSSTFADLQHAGRQLEYASSSLRALLDDPVPDLISPTLEPRDPHENETPRAKRRKLDSDHFDTGFSGFSYGRYGQVEPGKLKMEIVSCDGGIFQGNDTIYSAENVLRNDNSVYCTKSNRCNLVIRHQGGTVFSLKELVIKAPHSGFTAPVQEGMVFISMTSDDLLARTAQYQIQYSPPRRRRSISHPNDLPPILSVRHNDDGTLSTAQARARRLYHIGLEDEDCDHRTAQIPTEFTENAPPFQVTTECSDSEGEDPPSHANRYRLHRAMGLRFESSDSSDDEPADHSGNSWWEENLAGATRTPRLRRRETASNITLSEAAEASQIATQEAVRAVGGELMAPHARFFIERDKSKCTVRFDPPVSGRFILLKMWSPHHSASSNIDIQSVVARGFAGPRFFPAISMR